MGSEMCIRDRVFAYLLPQSFSKHRDVVGKISFFDETVGPDAFHQFVFSDHLGAGLNQREQQIKALGGKLHRLALSQQQTLRDVYTKRAELINALRLPGHVKVLITAAIQRAASDP